MKRLYSLLALSGALLALGVAPAQAEFGLTNLDVRFENQDGSPAMLAGAHPYALTIDLDAKTEELPGGKVVPIDAVKTIKIEQPSGFAGVPSAIPPCPAALFLEAASIPGVECPNETVLGKTTVTVGSIAEEGIFPVTTPVYNLDPPSGAILKLGFIAAGIPVTLEAALSPTYPYNPLVTVSNISQAAEFFSSSTTVWGNPQSPVHDAERGTCLETGAADKCPVSQSSVVPFITTPRSCSGPLVTLFEADSWQNPGAFVKEPPVLTHDDSEPPSPLGLAGCGELSFSPELDAAPTTDQAESPSGLDFEYSLDDEGIANPGGRAQSDMKKIVVTLPEGMTANPSLAEGLAVCSQAAFAAESVNSAPGEGCPQAAKIGTMEAESPLLPGTVFKGQLFIADPYKNPYGTLLGLYLVLRDASKGIFVGLPGKIEPDPKTGQLITTFGEAPYELPQFPLSNVRLHLREGGRSPLVTPAACGTYKTKAVITPWADPTNPVEISPSFQITSGVGGAPCPGPAPFAPGFSAGSINNNAASHSPFYIGLTRSDGDQDITRFSATLPPGVTARLTGTERCPEAQIAAARLKSGKAEQQEPSCPASSRIGSVITGAGVGSQLTYVGGSLYLAGPFEGAPLSSVAIVPAVAGPFDIGTVVVRQALRINPRSGQASVDGEHSEPIPHILAGIPLRVREIRALIDRPNFMLNPTSCNPFTVSASIWGGGADAFSGADDAPVAKAERYQAANCQALGFSPKLSIKLNGGTKRNTFPALRAVLTPRPGDANIGEAVVTLPHSAFLEQGHIRTICNRIKFAAHECPPGSIYGYARAFTPILPEPAEGPVYLRPNPEHILPDMVMALKGPAGFPVEVEVVGRIDSKNEGIRASFEETPDLPVTKLVLNMQGGKKGLIVNSRNLCTAPAKADVRLTGQNGKAYNFRPLVQNSCKKKGTKGKRR